MINLSDIARESLGIKSDEEVTEELLKSICDELMNGTTVPEINMMGQDEGVLLNYIDSTRVITFIDGQCRMFDKDYVRIINSIEDSSKTINIGLSQFARLYSKLDLDGKEIELYIQREDLENLSDHELDEIKEVLSSYQVKKTIFCNRYGIPENIVNIVENTDKLNEFPNLQIPNRINQSTLELISKDNWEKLGNTQEINVYIDDIATLETDKLKNFSNLKLFFQDTYYPEESLDAVEAIAEKIKELTSDIKDTDSEFDKFSKIYTKLAKSIVYDYQASHLIDKKRKGIEISSEEKKRIGNSQNLTGLLTRKNSLCRIFENSSSKFK